MRDIKLVKLPKYEDLRGNLSFVENDKQIPFAIKRTYWIYDVPGGEERGGHAFKETEEFIIALSGGFDVVVDDGTERKTYNLNRSYYGLYIPKGIWREITNISTNALALEFASTDFNPNDYVRDYDTYLMMKRNGEI